MNTLDLVRNDTDIVKFAADETIFREGEEGGRMYVVAEGTVKLSLTGRNLEKVSSGGFFGEMSVVDGAPRSATAVALTDCKLVAVSASRFEELVRQSPDFSLQIMRIMAKRLRSMDSRI
jgi:CRP-like cAMP-binding protein